MVIRIAPPSDRQPQWRLYLDQFFIVCASEAEAQRLALEAYLAESPEETRQATRVSASAYCE